MGEVDIKKLERSSPIIQVALELGIRIRGNMGRCFRHERHENGGSEAMDLFFNPAKNTFFCKVCPDLGGSVVDLVSQYRNLSREESVAWLCHRTEFDELTRARYNGKGRKKM